MCLSYERKYNLLLLLAVPHSLKVAYLCGAILFLEGEFCCRTSLQPTAPSGPWRVHLVVSITYKNCDFILGNTSQLVIFGVVSFLFYKISSSDPPFSRILHISTYLHVSEGFCLSNSRNYHLITTARAKERKMRELHAITHFIYVIAIFS